MASFTLSPLSIPSMNTITILVVEDDSTSLAFASAMLKQYHYQVTTTQSPYEALSTLRARPEFDLVITDLHLPGMTGLQLKQHIDEEFKLPVIVMSGNDEESVVSESLAYGVLFYIVKPMSTEDLTNIGQYVSKYKKGKSPIVEEIDIFNGESEGESSLLDYNNPRVYSDGHIPSPARGACSVSSSTNNNNENGETQTKKRKYTRKGMETDNDLSNNNPPAPKKPKVVWTNSLHYRFLLAVRHIGLDRAVPKKILECMNVPGITRENIASHLQKYRIFLKKVAELSLCPSTTMTERALRSTFATAHAMMIQQERQLNFLEQHNHMRGLYGGSNTTTFPQAFNPPSDRFSTIRFPGQGNMTPPFGQNQGYGQSSLLFNPGSRNFGTNSSAIGGNLSSRMLNNAMNNVTGANFPLGNMYPQGGNQARPGFFNAAGNYNGFFDSDAQQGQSVPSSSTLNNSGTSNTFLGASMFGNGELGLNQPFQFNGTTNGNGGTGCYGYDVNRSNVNVAPNLPMFGNESSGTLGQGTAFLGQVPNQGSAPMAMPPSGTTNQQANTTMLPQVPDQGGLFDHGSRGAEAEVNLENLLDNSFIFDDNINIDTLFDSHTNLPSNPQGEGDQENNGTGGHIIPPEAEYNPLLDMQNANYQIQNGGDSVNNTEVNNINPSNNAYENQVCWDADFINNMLGLAP